jgi:hypothetical protein
MLAAVDAGDGAALMKIGHTPMAGEGQTVRPRPISGVEIRERHPRGGGVRYSYRVRFQNAQGEREGRTFDCAQDAVDFRARLRLLKRADDLGVLESGRESLEQFMVDFWRLYAEPRSAPRPRGS